MKTIGAVLRLSAKNPYTDWHSCREEARKLVSSPHRSICMNQCDKLQDTIDSITQKEKTTGRIATLIVAFIKDKLNELLDSSIVEKLWPETIRGNDKFRWANSNVFFSKFS